MKQCIRSMFVWHNETVNIWTHLAGAVLFGFFISYPFHESNPLVAIKEYFPFTSPYGTMTWMDQAMMTLYLITAGICLFCSCAFHTFHCHDHIHVFDRMAITDYTGIATLLFGSFTALVYFAFRPYPDLLPWPLTVTAVASLSGMILPWFPFFRSYHYRTLRTFIFIGLAASVTTTFAWACIQIGEEISQSWEWTWVFWVAACICSYGGGMTLSYPKSS
jgi:adiponectin receptor